MTNQIKNMRKRPSPNVDSRFLLEVGGVCPLCGSSLLELKNGRNVKQYEVAHIYPCNPTKEQIRVLDGLIKCEDSEAFENKISLCHSCHKRQDFHTTAEEYIKLYDIKQQCLRKSIAKDHLSLETIGQEIRIVVDNLAFLSETSLVSLNLNAVHVKKKILSNVMLTKKIENNVVEYFQYIKECFLQLESEGRLRFNLIASKVRTAYISVSTEERNQDEVFDALVEWLNSQTQNKYRIACEIIISFFVQNCEVFDVITE